ncbi:MAG TPA: substrate-binding domain-containing protein [Conexibacter sp.]|nr:substrate-binding domain-containing protein [Conexibacter sp.]
MHRMIKRALLPAAVGAAAVALSAPAAQAGFNVQKCNGASIVGGGSSLQKIIQQNIWTVNDGAQGGFAGSNANLSFCLPGTPFNDNNNTITYNSIGSGAGKALFDSDGAAPYRAGNGPARFFASDDAPTPTEIANMDAGDPSTTADDAHIRVIPVATAAATISVHFPEGCKWRTDYDWKVNNTDFTTRFKLPNTKWEQVFDGSISTWGQLLAISPTVAGISAIPGSGKTNAQCVSTPIKRAVRSDVSGTTYNFKQWLKSIDPSQSPSWDETDPGGLGNLDWPNDSGATAVARGNGNGGVAAVVAATNGSVGYVDLATARANGFDMTPADTLLRADRTFWVPVQNGSAQYLDPQTQEFAYKAGTTDRGAACNKATVTNIPTNADPTLDTNWSHTLAINSPAGYGLCLITYMGAWDDDKDAYGFGTGGSEQNLARTVKDYVTYATAGTGQSLLPRYDYAKLPTSLISIAQGGANAINWNK